MDLSRYNITGEKEAASTVAKNNFRLLKLRWVYMSVVAGVATATTVFSTGALESATTYLGIFLLGLLLNALLFVTCYLFQTRLRTQHLVTLAQLTLDMAMAGIVTYLEGGVTARTTVLFMFPVLAAALIFRGQLVLLVASMSGLSYVVAVLVEQYTNNRFLDWTILVVPLLFYPVVFLILGRIAMYLEQLGVIEAREKAYTSFLSLIAHQLKHPASATTTIIDAMSHDKKVTLDDEAKRYIEMLKAENENQIRLIDNLLEAAPHSSRTLQREAVDLVMLVSKIAERAAKASERSDDIEVLPGSISRAMAEVSSFRLSLALTNIFDNAFRYSKPGQKVAYQLQVKSGEVKIVIRDNGKGMSETEIAHQLERFTNQGIRGMDDGHLGGLGLGLFAASQIVGMHHGHLNIHSGSGIGTTVIILLPKGEKT